MSVTLWDDIPKGQRCEQQYCTNYATHLYGSHWMCCDCHVGELGGGLVTNEEAKKYHEN